MVTTVCAATPTVVAVKVCEVLPAGTTMGLGTVTAELPLFIVTLTPPADAAWLRVTVPTELVPPITAGGTKARVVTTVTGSTVTLPVTIVDPVVAVHVSGVAVITAPAVTIKVVEFVPPGTTTLPGTGSAEGLPQDRPTLKPLTGAAPFKVTVPVVVCPETTLLGLNESWVTTGGFTVSPPVAVLAPNVAVTVTGVVTATGTVVAVNVVDVLLTGTTTFAGTATDGSLLPKETVVPPVGEAWLSVTVPVELVPPVRVAGLNISEVTIATPAACSTTPPAETAL
jgi:hypothetical protein